jgi:hypothetical protein
VTDWRWSRIVAAGILAGLLAAMVSGATEPNALSREKRSGWDGLGLIKSTVDGTTIYYEEALEPNLPIFEREITALLAEREKVAAVLARSSEIVADINRVLGASDANAVKEEKLLTDMGGLVITPKLSFHLVSTPTVEAYLREGGQLPDFSYDAQTDTMQYEPRIHVEPGQEPPENYDLFISGEPGGAFVKQLFGMFSGRSAMSVGVHMATEAALMQRARTGGAHWRWFIDGFASAITERMIDKYIGPETAMEFEAAHSPYKFRELENQINLRYWLVRSCCPYKEDEIPVESESRILHARSAYAMFEAKRLIDSNGIDRIRRMLDVITARSLQSRSDLVAAIKEVTGQDMEPRLDRYQAFKDEEEGIKTYTEAFDAAAKSTDYEKMFVNLMRVIELQSAHPSLSHLRDFTTLAVILWKMGHEEAADRAMQNGVQLYSQEHIPGGRKVAMEAFATYALATNRPRKAEKTAGELLQTDPNDVPALAVKMVLSKDDGRIVEAKEFARQIQRFAKPRSDFYRNASKVLAIDPNQPNTYNRAP